MDDRPLVSIVTPSLNQGAFIRATIESVLSQDYPNLEYWVMDGGSNDETTAVLADHVGQPRLQWRSGRDGGQAAAIQDGWRRCHGQILAWLNADDLYRPDAISRALAAFQDHADAALVYGRAALIDVAGQPIGQINNPSLGLADLLGLVDFLPQPAVFFRAAAVHQAGGLNTALHYAFDFDLILRLAALGRFHYVDEELAAYRWHSGAKTATAFYQMRREAAQVSRAFLQQRPPKLTARAQRHFASYAHLVEAYACWRLGRRRAFVHHTVAGLIRSPANIHWILRRTWKQLRRPGGNGLAYPYDPALS
jgi:glycosyltransferase involved in cell wall biosynthesis